MTEVRSEDRNQNERITNRAASDENMKVHYTNKSQGIRRERRKNPIQKIREDEGMKVQEGVNKERVSMKAMKGEKMRDGKDVGVRVYRRCTNK